MDKAIIVDAACCYHCKYSILYYSFTYCNIGNDMPDDDDENEEEKYEWKQSHYVEDHSVCPFFEVDSYG